MQIVGSSSCLRFVDVLLTLMCGQYERQMEGQFDMFLSKEDQAKFPDPEPLLHVCTKFDLEPTDVLVLARHAATIKAAKYVH